MIDGKNIAGQVRETIAEEVTHYASLGYRKPGLSVVIVGEDPASQTYVSSKVRQAKKLGFVSETIALPEDTDQKTLIQCVEALNKNPNVDGILVQLPLPKHIDEQVIIETIAPQKDVDGLHPINVGYLTLGMEKFVPCTPKGIMTLLEKSSIELEGKRVLVLGRSRLVGKPMAALMTTANATVTLAHSKTKEIQTLIAEHDIIIVAIGKPEWVKKAWLLPHQVVIDVGIHRREDGLCGDVEKEAYEYVHNATPVPGGVGPMTIASLFENTMMAYKRTLQNG